jgi:hypothetical protein
MFVILFEVEAFSVKRVTCDSNSLLRSLAILPENIGYYFALRYLIVGAETIIYCAENSH